MSKLQKVILVYDDHTQIAEGEDARRYDEMLGSAASILHGRIYNPFAGKQVNWSHESPDAHDWWKRANKLPAYTGGPLHNPGQ